MRNKNTWDNVSSTWKHGNTKVIRVPVSLANRVIEYARKLDNGLVITTDDLIQEFIALKQAQASRLPQRYFVRETPTWKVFNEFERYTKSQLTKKEMTQSTLKQDIQKFCDRFLTEEIDIEDIAMQLQKLADRAWDEAVQDVVPPSLQII